MSRGVLLVARNNSEIDYIQQAVFSANRIKEYMNLPTSVITDDASYIKTRGWEYAFDNIIEVQADNGYTFKKYNDGAYARKTLEFKNNNRCNAYALSPYTETLLLDTDFIIANNSLNQCFSQPHDLLMYSSAVNLIDWQDLTEFDFISNTGPKFYWATCVFFRKSPDNLIFFNLIGHIQENWNHYRNLYQIATAVFRNDFAFSIATHILNGYSDGSFVNEMPGRKYFATDKDAIIELNGDKFLFLVERENSGMTIPVQITGNNVHIMNKFSLGRLINCDS